MARQRISGSVSTRRVIAVRPTADEYDIISAYAAQWGCSLSEATLRLVRAGVQAPQLAEPDQRVAGVYKAMRGGLTVDEICDHCSRQWGLTRRQSHQLIAQARILMESTLAVDHQHELASARQRLAQFEGPDRDQSGRFTSPQRRSDQAPAVASAP